MVPQEHPEPGVRPKTPLTIPELEQSKAARAQYARLGSFSPELRIRH
jgi:hypothetical protein